LVLIVQSLDLLEWETNYTLDHQVDHRMRMSGGIWMWACGPACPIEDNVWQPVKIKYAMTMWNPLNYGKILDQELINTDWKPSNISYFFPFRFTFFSLLDSCVSSFIFFLLLFLSLLHFMYLDALVTCS